MLFFLDFTIGEPVYEAVRPIAANTELVVFYLPNLHEDEEELLYGGLPAIRSLRSSLFRRTMGLILQGSCPLVHIPVHIQFSLDTNAFGEHKTRYLPSRGTKSSEPEILRVRTREQTSALNISD